MRLSEEHKLTSAWERAAFGIALILAASALIQMVLRASPAEQAPDLTRVGDDLGEVHVELVGSDQPIDLHSVTR